MCVPRQISGVRVGVFLDRIRDPLDRRSGGSNFWQISSREFRDLRIECVKHAKGGQQVVDKIGSRRRPAILLFALLATVELSAQMDITKVGVRGYVLRDGGVLRDRPYALQLSVQGTNISNELGGHADDDRYQWHRGSPSHDRYCQRSERLDQRDRHSSLTGRRNPRPLQSEHRSGIMPAVQADRMPNARGRPW